MLAALVAADELPLSGLGQLGAVGVVLSIFLTFAWVVYKRERDRADANAAEVARLNALIIDRYVPSLERATEALAAITTYRDAPPPRRRP